MDWAPLVLILSLLGVFFACILGQLALTMLIQRRLVTSHPDVWLKWSRKVWFAQNIIFRFSQGGEHRKLGDARLTRLVMLFRWTGVIAILDWLLFVGALVLGVPHLPK